MFLNVDDLFFERVVDLVQAGGRVSHATTYAPHRLRLRGVEVLDSRRYYDLAWLRRENARRTTLSDLQMVEKCGSIEGEALAMFERFNAGKLGVLHLHALVAELIVHWAAFFRTSGVTTAFFESTPHMGWDFLVFHVARVMGVRTLVLARTLFDDSVVLLENELDFKSWDCVVEPRARHDPASRQIASRLASALRAGEKGYWLAESDRINDQVIGRSASQPPLKAVRAALYSFRKNVDLVKDEAGFISAFALGGASRRRLLSHQLALQTKYARLRELYDGLARPPTQTGSDAVYFALHFQPERSTQPEAGRFYDQLFAVRYLASQLEGRCEIWVKEHPRQFSGRQNSYGFRTADFYESLAAIPGVRLIPLDTDSKLVLRSCRAVATMTGSVGWQAITTGRIAFCFARPWYSLCRACIRLGDTSEDGISVPRALERGASAADVDEFVERLAYHTIESSNCEKFARRSSLSYEVLTGNLAAAITARAEARA